jgi:hypothetical protein
MSETKFHTHTKSEAKLSLGNKGTTKRKQTNKVMGHILLLDFRSETLICEK